MLTRRRHRGLGGAAPFYPVSIPYSCRFDSARSCKLTRTPAGAGNRKTFQVDTFVKRCRLGAQNTIFFADGASNDDYLEFTSGDALTLVLGGTTIRTTTAIYRDPSQHMHICLMVDTTQATAGDRVKLYVNGSLVTAFSATADPALNAEYNINTAVPHTIGLRGATYANIYISRFVLVDGTTPGPFVSASSGNASVYVPKAVSATYGTNGFHLDFADAAALGNDVSGNNNDYTSSGLTSGDQFADTPTNNYCTLNPVCLSPSAPPTLSEGNLKCVTTTSNNGHARGSFGMSSGKWYWEGKISAAANPYMQIGVAKEGAGLATPLLGGDAYGYSYGFDGTKWIAGTSTGSFGAAYGNGDVIGVALDMDSGTLAFYKNNSLQGTAATGLTGTLFPAISDGNAGTSTTMSMNFGATAFAYTPPAGFKALCTSNMTTPLATIATSGTFTGNANANGPFVYTGGTPDSLSIDSNAVTWGTHADKLANGFKIRTAAAGYNDAAANNWTAVTTLDRRFPLNNAQDNP